MEIKITPLAEINARALDVLYREMGPIDTARFINQYFPGLGDYTEEREDLFPGMTVDDLVSEINKDSAQSI